MTQAVAAIRRAHHLQDVPSPTDHPRIGRILKGNSDNWGRPTRQARPLTTDDIRGICDYIDRKGRRAAMSSPTRSPTAARSSGSSGSCRACALGT